MKITGIGETVLDMVFKDRQVQAAVPGGSAFNSIISLGRCFGRRDPGTEVVMITQTGSDPVSEIMLSFMQENGVSTRGVVRSEGQSTLSIAMLSSAGNAEYEFYHDPAPRPFRAPEIEFSKGDLVLFGSFFAINPKTRDEVRRLVRKARSQGATVYYDINFRKSHDGPGVREQIEENMALSDIVRGSNEDIEALYGSSDPEKAYPEHISKLCNDYICTKGALETEIFGPGALRVTIPVPGGTKVVSTIGAGDNFNAGVLYHIARVRQEKGGNSLPSTAKEWADITNTAHKFSANVVASMFNYVDPSFDPGV